MRITTDSFRLAGMRKTRDLLAAGIMLMMTSICLAEDTNSPKLGFTIDYFSKYVTRGQNFDNSSVMQPTVSAGAYGLTGSFWGNMDMTNKSETAPDNAWEFSEYDWTLDYTNTIPGIDWLSGSVGTIYYQYPNTHIDSTTEIYTGLGLSTVPLSPSFKWYRDVQAIKGSYLQFSIGHTIEKVYVINEKCCCGLQFGASYGWGNAAYDKGNFGVNKAHSNDLTFSAAFCIEIDSIMVKPGINYSTLLDSSIQDATNKSDNLWAGVGISHSF